MSATVISQGIGSPAGVSYFLLVGLHPSGLVGYTAARTITLDGREFSGTLLDRDTTLTVDGREATLTLRDFP